MAQHDYNIANQSGAAFRADLNNALAAIVSQNSGASAPSTTFAYQLWADTTTGILKIRNAANAAWVELMQLDGTLTMEDGTVGAPGLAFRDDLNTGLFSDAADTLGIATNGVERVEFGTSEVVFNDGGADVDFRVEGDTQTHLIYVDAGNDRVGIGTNAPGTLIEIDNAAPYITFKNNTEEDTAGGRESRLIFEGEQSGGEISTLVQIEASHDGTADDEKGKLIISTNDGNDGAAPTAAVTIDSTQKVTIAGSLTASGINYPTSGSLSGRNRVINGSMTVDQRNAGAAVTVNNGAAYSVDRWIVEDGSDAVLSAQQTTDAPSGQGFTNSLQVTATTADASIGSTQFVVITQSIEGFNTADLNFGNSSALPVTVSFWVKATVAGQYSCTIYNAGASRINPQSFTINSSNTWEPKTITFVGDTAGTWLTNNGRGILLSIYLALGSTYLGAAGWNGSSIYGVTGQANAVANTNNIFAITGVQLEAGSVATPFERRSYGQELSLCQRYFNRYNFQSAGWNTSATNSIGAFTFPVMRDTPNYSLVGASIAYGPGGQQSVSSLNGIGINNTSMRSGFVISGGLTINAGSVIFGTMDLEKEL